MKVLSRIIAYIMCLLAPVFLVGCGEEESTLSFNDLSTLLLEFDTDVRPFLSTLEYNNSTDEELSLTCANITNLSYQMGESFKSLNTAMMELENAEDELTEVTASETEIKIKTGTIDFISKMNKDKTEMSVVFLNGESESVYELKKLEDGSFFAQIAIKNVGLTTYTIYQIRQVGTTGKLAIGYAENKYVSIFGAELTAEVFPSLTEKTYEI